MFVMTSGVLLVVPSISILSKFFLRHRCCITEHDIVKSMYTQTCIRGGSLLRAGKATALHITCRFSYALHMYYNCIGHCAQMQQFRDLDIPFAEHTSTMPHRAHKSHLFLTMACAFMQPMYPVPDDPQHPSLLMLTGLTTSAISLLRGAQPDQPRHHLRLENSPSATTIASHI
ncbi:hypothetical protein FB567DRAFT_322787 [Paraphoma chrysanthemicola]|uniref:Secreted protein n=1 Tax=Paraphoma chrysanthemicola TaxID=798071 RepID=A0A8K0W0B2_9PLEO|nr:hypothetical protein FB567DRAFT_322787 [Paraphoma chrysanthemicola]